MEQGSFQKFFEQVLQEKRHLRTDQERGKQRNRITEEYN